MKRNLWIFVTLAILGFTIADDALNKILSQLEKYRSEFPQEKVHLHFDKPYYAGGDSIWFKAYVVKGENNQLSDISNILYAELINNKDSVVQSLRIPLSLGLGSGSFSLTDTLKEGNYRVRAYTQWMRNFDEDFFYDKIVPIGSISGDTILTDPYSLAGKFPAKNTLPQYDVQFFPEGGDLVAGIQSRIAFKAVDQNGLGININGYVTDNNNNKIAEFQSEHAGLGAFTLQPQAGQAYLAHVSFDDGSERTFKLPNMLLQGYGMNIDNSDPENLTIRITTSELAASADITLIAQSNGITHYVSKAKMDRHILKADILKKRFPTGIIQFTLFSDRQEPVAERLIFINHQNDLNVSVNTSKMIYKQREKVKMTLDVKNPNGSPAIGSFSLAVIDESKVPYDDQNETTILSNLLLTSDLKGYIERPNYYFTSIDEYKIRQLDILMMTHGWRRFVWKNILADEFKPLAFKPEKGIEISGKVTSLLSGKAISGGKVTLLPLSDTDLSLLADTITDSEGKFKFTDLFFPDGTTFNIQARNLKDRKNTVIKVDHIPAQAVAKSDIAEIAGLNGIQSLYTYLKNSKDQHEELKRYGLFNQNLVLKEVKVTANAVNTSTYNRIRYGFSDKTIREADLKNCMDLFACLPRAGGIIIKNGSFYLTRGTALGVILDGVPVSNDDVQFINPQDIETIELYKLQGLLVMNTKRGELNASTKYMSGITSHIPKGYYKERIFYSPNYEDPKINFNIRDLRSTIFWAPHVLTDSAGKAVVEFFNADGNGSYRTIVEGISVDGKLGRQIYRYQVK